MRRNSIAGTSLLFLLAVPASATFQGSLTSRSFTVSSERLVTLLGGGATNAQKVFAIPTDRLAELAKTPGSGVEVRTTTMLVNGKMGRVDGLGADNSNYILFDLDKGAVRVVNPTKKGYVDLNPATAEQPPTPAKAPVLRPLGKTEKIAGFTATAYQLTDEGETVVVWVSNDNPELTSLYRTATELFARLNAGSKDLTDTATRLAQVYGLPVRVQTLSTNGYKLREVSVPTAKNVSADLFTLPKDVKLMSRSAATNPQGAPAKPQGAPPKPQGAPPKPQPQL